MKKRVLNILGAYGTKYAGHGEIDLDTEIDLAKQLFEEAIAANKLVFVRETAESQWILTEEWKPESERIIITPRLQGG